MEEGAHNDVIGGLRALGRSFPRHEMRKTERFPATSQNRSAAEDVDGGGGCPDDRGLITVKDEYIRWRDREIKFKDAKIGRIKFELARLKAWKSGAQTEAMNAHNWMLVFDRSPSCCKLRHCGVFGLVDG